MGQIKIDSFFNIFVVFIEFFSFQFVKANMSAEPEKYYVDKWFNYKFDKKYEGWYDKWYPKMGNFEVPHYTQYKDIEGIWQLEFTRDKLAKYGLKDPWMRYFFYSYSRIFCMFPSSLMIIISSRFQKTFNIRKWSNSEWEC